MLEKIRSASQTWYFKAFLGFLAVCFVILWGVGDMLFLGGKRSSQSVVTVGKVSIYPTEFIQHFNQESARIQSIIGQKLSLSQLQQLGIVQETLRRLIQGALIDQEADYLGLVVTDEDVRNKTHMNQAFLDSEGHFDREIFETFLRNVNLTEKDFIHLMRQRIRRIQLIGGLEEQIDSVPELLAEPVFLWKNQKRQVSYTYFLAKDQEREEPSEQDLISFHQDYSALFMNPEKRGISYLVLTSPESTEENQGKEDQEALYAFSVKIEETLSEGLTLEEVALKYNLELHTVKEMFATSDQNIEGNHKPELKEEEFVRVAFETPEGELSSVFLNTEGTAYFVLRVNSVSPSHLQPLEDIKEKVVKFWQEKRQMEAAESKAQDLVARTMGQEDKIPFDGMFEKSYVLTRDGPGAEEIREKLTLREIQKIFELDQGQAFSAPLVDQATPGYGVFKVDDIILVDPESWREEEKNALQKELIQSVSHDIFTSFVVGLEKKYKIHINHQVLKEVLSYLSSVEGERS